MNQAEDSRSFCSSWQQLLQSHDQRTPEDFVRRAVAQLESDRRELALIALGDWDKLDIVSAQLFQSIASLQRPSGGSFNSLILTIRKTCQHTRQHGSADEKQRLAQATRLTTLLEFYSQRAQPALIADLLDLSEICRDNLGKRATIATLLALPITLRNRMIHDAPSEASWWEKTAAALLPLLDFLATNEPLPLSKDYAGRDWPWFMVQDNQVWAFNGLTHNFSAIYVSAQGQQRYSDEGGRQVLLVFQRLLGRGNIKAKDFRKFLGNLAPEEIKGVLLGDYLVGRPVGSGGFATVHVGYHVRTGRKVAVKLLHDGQSKELRARFQREASYLARFNHNNIVGVLGYGKEAWSAPRSFSLDHEPWYREFSKSAPIKHYIAMEWVEGRTLEEVFQDSERHFDQRETVRWFIQAADALVVVHQASLIHRDIKPANIMVTEEGLIKLMDFGIAKGQDDGKTQFTATGVAVGTFAYMSPEQMRAEDQGLGPATDIYSLCATFYELLTQHRLFGHDRVSTETLRHKKLQGENPQRPRLLNGVLSWEVQSLVMGGLEAEVDDRPATAENLRDDLERYLQNRPIHYRRPSLLRRLQLTVRRNRRQLIPWLLVLLVLLTGGVLFYLDQSQQQMCQGANRHLAGIWDQGSQSQIELAFAKTKQSTAKDTWQRVQQNLTRYTNSWAHKHTQVCRATYVHGEQSGDLLDLRMACFEARLMEVRALVQQLTRANHTTVERAVEATLQLSPLELCQKLGIQKRSLALPKDPQTRLRIKQIEQQLADAKAMFNLGSYDDSEALAKQALASAEQVKHFPVLAKARYELGSHFNMREQFEEGQKLLVQAYREADAGADDQTRFLAAVTLVGLLGSGQAKFKEGLQWAQQAEYLLHRLDDNGLLKGRLYGQLGLLYLNQGDFKLAATNLEQAVHQVTQALGTEAPELGQQVINLGNAYFQLGQLDKALQVYQQGYTLYLQTYGPSHPYTAKALLNKANVLMNQGKNKEALPLFEQVLSIQVQALGEEDIEVSSTLGNMGIVHDNLGQHKRALEHYQRSLLILQELPQRQQEMARLLVNLGSNALSRHEIDQAIEYSLQSLAIRKKLYGEDSPQVALVFFNIGLMLQEAKRQKEALDYLLQTQANWEKTLPREHPYMTELYCSLGHTYRMLKKNTQAQRLLQRCLDLREQAGGEDNSDLVRALLEMALLDLQRGKAAAARVTLDRAQPLCDKQTAANASNCAMVHFATARSIADSKGDLAEARQLAEQARRVLAKESEAHKELLLEIRDWQRRHP